MSEPSAVDGASQHDELAAIWSVVATIQHTQRHELAEEFIALFIPDATWVTGGGRRLIGRHEIAEFTRRVLPGSMSELSVTYEVVHTVFVRPDVAVVSVRQRYLSRDGEPLVGETEGRPTYVMAKDSAGDWKLAAGQNTGVQDD